MEIKDDHILITETGLVIKYDQSPWEEIILLDGTKALWFKAKSIKVESIGNFPIKEFR